jgi:serine/threonine-protein kinase
VEVLNEVGNVNSVKELLEVLKDDDWWVRSRAGDALAEIGGPKVVDSVVALINDEDEEIRRTAIEILNAAKDERAVDHLIAATDDSDWWVRERAVDALSKIGNPKALPKLESMLGKDTKTDTVVVRALAKLGNHKHIPLIVPLLKSPDRELQIEAVKALSKLADETHADTVRTVLRKIKQDEEPTVINMADKALKDLDARFSDAHAAAGRQGSREAARRAGQGPNSRCIARRHDCRGHRTASPGDAAARHLQAKARRHHRGALQVHREDRQRCLWHRATDAGRSR